MIYSHKPLSDKTVRSNNYLSTICTPPILFLCYTYDMEKIEWTAPEYIHTQKTTDWYWIVGIVTLTIAIISIVLNNIIFALLIIIGMGTLCMYASREPRRVPIEISPAGVRIGGYFYPYDNLDSFWVETNDAYPRVIFKSQKKMMLYITALIENVDPDEIKNMLVTHLKEEYHTEPLLEKLLIYFGF